MCLLQDYRIVDKYIKVCTEFWLQFSEAKPSILRSTTHKFRKRPAAPTIPVGAVWEAGSSACLLRSWAARRLSQWLFCNLWECLIPSHLGMSNLAWLFLTPQLSCLRHRINFHRPVKILGACCKLKCSLAHPQPGHLSRRNHLWMKQCPLAPQQGQDEWLSEWCTIWHMSRHLATESAGDIQLVNSMDKGMSSWLPKSKAVNFSITQCFFEDVTAVELFWSSHGLKLLKYPKIRFYGTKWPWVRGFVQYLIPQPYLWINTCSHVVAYAEQWRLTAVLAHVLLEVHETLEIHGLTGYWSLGQGSCVFWSRAFGDGLHSQIIGPNGRNIA